MVHHSIDIGQSLGEILESSLGNTTNYSEFYQNSQHKLHKKHYQEWLDSGVDEEIIVLNTITLEGDTTHQYLLEDALGKLGDGKQTPHSSQYATTEVSRILRQYHHTLNGGWWCSGVDPLNGYAPMNWGCFKPTTPRPDHKKPGKIIKYEHPYKVPTRAFFLRVPRRIWQMIADRHGVPIGNYKEFWHWVQYEQVPIIICEGVKKAAALLSCGFVAIAIPGINSGYRKLENIGRHLIADILAFTKVPREFIICFDNDSKVKTKIAVDAAINNFGKLLIKGGNSRFKHHVNVATWNYPEKGIDDVLVAYGSDTVTRIIDDSIPLSKWQCRKFYQLSKKINLPLNQRYLGDILKGIEHKIVGVKSAKNTGKTESLINLVVRLFEAGYKVYLASHRIQLCQAICKRLNIPYIDDLTDKNNGYGFVIDSYHNSGKCNVDIENDYNYLTDDYVVIIDEVEQVLWHLFDSNTEVKKHRTQVIKQFELLLNNSNQIYALDADLTDVSIDYLKSVCECDNDDIFIIKNDYKPDGYKAYIYNNPVQLMGSLLGKIGEGKKVFVCTDSQKLKSPYSTQNIEKLINKKYPDKKVLIIDSHTIADFTHPAYGCITKINQIILGYDIVIASPTVGTGISIDVRNYFDAVYGIFQGVQGENSVRQQLIRLRENVDRHLFIAKTGLSYQGDGSSCLTWFISCQKKSFKIHINQLKNIGYDIGLDDIDTNDKALATYAKMACRINYEMKNYRDFIIENLANEGNKIIILDDIKDDDLKAEIKENRDLNHNQELEDVANIDISDMDDTGYEKLVNTKNKTKEDKYREKKYSIQKKYQVEVTPDLIALDVNGYYPQLRLHYYLTLGNQFLADKDTKKAQKVKDAKQVFLPDFNPSQWTIKINLLKALNIPEILQLDKLTQSHPLLTDMADKVRGNILDVGMFLGKLHPDLTTIQILRKILKLLGLKLIDIGKEGTGARNRIYKVLGLNDGRKEIFEKWYHNDTSQNENCIIAIPNTSQIGNINTISNQDVAINHNQPTNKPQTEPEHTPKNCLVWDGLNGQWVGGVVKSLETTVNGTFKALITLWNGLDRYIWKSSDISIC